MMFRVVFVLLLLSLLGAGSQSTVSERIAKSIKERVASASNHAVINKNAATKAAATAPKPQPKKRATYSQQKASAVKIRGTRRKPKAVKYLKS